MLLDLGRAEEAVAALDKVLARQSTCFEAWMLRGAGLFSLARHAEAVVSYDKALALSPGAVRIWIDRGHALDASGQKQEALAGYERALELAAENQSVRWRSLQAPSRSRAILVQRSASRRYSPAHSFRRIAENFHAVVARLARSDCLVGEFGSGPDLPMRPPRARASSASFNHSSKFAGEIRGSPSAGTSSRRGD